MQHSHCHCFMPFFCCNEHIVLWWKMTIPANGLNGCYRNSMPMTCFSPPKFQVVLPCTSNDRHTIAVNTESDMVKFWISPSPSFTHNLTCHFWNSKSLSAKVCLRMKKSEMKHAISCIFRTCWVYCSSYLRLKCCSHRECCVFKASWALNITFQTLFLFQLSKWKSLK